MKLRTLTAAAGTVLLTTLFAAPAVQADEPEAATVTDVGWWSSTAAGGAATAEPPGGFQVSQDPQGAPTAVAAIKLNVRVKQLASALFVFTEGPTRLSEASAVVLMCKGTNNWTAANPGALADAPKADCSKSVQLKRSATLQSWSGDPAALITGPGVFTLVIVPGDPKNYSSATPSYESLPHLMPPVALPVGIPPPLPIDPGSPDPIGGVLSTADCPPGFYDITAGLGMPQQCLGLPRVVPPTPLPALPLPATVDLPVPLGFQVEMTSTQLSAIPQDDSSFSDVGDLSAAGGGISDSGLFATGPSVLGSGLSAGAPPLTEAGAAALNSGTGGLGSPGGVQLASSGKGRPWGRIWLLAIVAIGVGAGSTWARRKTAELGL